MYYVFYYCFTFKALTNLMAYSHFCSHGHKNIVLSVKWNQNGNWLLTASKDQIIKVRLTFLGGVLICNLDFVRALWKHLYDTYACNLQLYDIRTMKELQSFRGHTKDVTCKLSNSLMTMSSNT